MPRTDLLKDIRDFRAQAIELRACRTRADEALKLSYQLLRIEVPDTFLGRSQFLPTEESSTAASPRSGLFRGQ